MDWVLVTAVVAAGLAILLGIVCARPKNGGW